MECPLCQIPLYETKYKRIEVDRCKNCHGMWLDYHELDELEDKTFDNDDLKGTLMYAVRDSKKSCPRCITIMKTFNYRAYNLPIDVCQNNDGFWLDKGEAEQVEKLMQQRIKDLKRSASAESAWVDLIKGLKSGKGKSFMGRIMGR
tara:strand:+ start:153 stop:590 length:438 start_codon:yes stop_codon:yes gene_type:complete